MNGCDLHALCGDLKQVYGLFFTEDAYSNGLSDWITGTNTTFIQDTLADPDLAEAYLARNPVGDAGEGEGAPEAAGGAL